MFPNRTLRKRFTILLISNKKYTAPLGVTSPLRSKIRSGNRHQVCDASAYLLAMPIKYKDCGFYGGSRFENSCEYKDDLSGIFAPLSQGCPATSPLSNAGVVSMATDASVFYSPTKDLVFPKLPSGRATCISPNIWG